MITQLSKHIITSFLFYAKNKPETLSEPLVSEISNQISHKASLGIPTQNKTLSGDQRKLLSLHYRLGHMSFQSLKKIAKLGLIPHQLSKVNPVPLCPLFIFATAKKHAWQTKAAPHTIRKPIDACPGDCVSVDQIVSGQSDMIPQSSGFSVND